MTTISEALAIAIEHHQAGRLADAEHIYRQILQQDENQPAAWHLLGLIAHQVGEHQLAVDYISRAIQLNDREPAFVYNLGNILKSQGELQTAVPYYQRAIELNPNNLEAHNNLGATLKDLGDFPSAIRCYQRALEIKPDTPHVWINLVGAWKNHGNLDAALTAATRAIELQPNSPEAHQSLGDILRHRGKLDAAIASFDRALELNPVCPDAQFNRAFTLLLAGDWERGWPAYECRWQRADSPLRHTSRPLWNGESLAGKTILLYTEQGLGDAIQFVRYAAVVKKLGGTVIVECHKPLRSLLASCPGIDHLIVQGETPPEFDLQAPLMSLPRILKQTLKDIPREIPYLSARPDLCDRWREKLREITGLKIGIVWQGGRVYIKDRFRSFPLLQLAPLAKMPNVHLISLQTGFGTEQLAEARQQFPIIDFGEELDQESGPFMDTAAVMKNLDLVITPDTATAHLAGALGVPVWVALSFAPDWRNMLHRTDSPWYPTMRLFRQTDFGHWPSVFEQMSHALRERL